MNIDDYKREVLKTDGNHDLAYYFLKLGSEAGEVQQDYAKHIKHDLTFGQLQTGVQDELGDMMWYWMMIHTKLGLDPVVTLQQNIVKLRHRYGRGATHTLPKGF